MSDTTTLVRPRRTLRDLRIEAGLSMRQVSEVTKVSESRICRIERSEVDSIRADTAKALATYFGREVSEIDWLGVSALGIHGPAPGGKLGKPAAPPAALVRRCANVCCRVELPLATRPEVTLCEMCS